MLFVDNFGHLLREWSSLEEHRPYGFEDVGRYGNDSDFGDTSDDIYPKSRIGSLCKVPGAADQHACIMITWTFQTCESVERRGENDVDLTFFHMASARSTRSTYSLRVTRGTTLTCVF